MGPTILSRRKVSNALERYTAGCCTERMQECYDETFGDSRLEEFRHQIESCCWDHDILVEHAGTVQEFFVARQGLANKHPRRESGDNIKQRVVHLDLTPGLGVSAPILLEAVSQLVDNIVGEAAEPMSKLPLDHLGMNRLANNIWMKKSVVSLEELPVDFCLVENGVWLLQEPPCLGHGEHYFRAREGMRKYVCSVVLGILRGEQLVPLSPGRFFSPAQGNSKSFGREAGC